MPTPVGVARQCLSEAAVAVLDDAVAVARRRSHAQTTTLHVVSALLAVPSSPLREACARAWSSAYSPRLQFRALELCVGVALDRVSVSKSASAADEPPVSNSLMAAIKRSQASQRRHPDTFHLYQQQLSSNSLNSPSISAVKVELKHFLTSILDDPIVSRVFGDAGFRTQEIKLSVLNPLAMSRFAVTASRPPPLFACNLDNFELDRRGHSFPFIEAAAKEKLDENPRKIGEVLLKKTRRNPLLVGASGSDAYKDFVDCLRKGESGVVPKELDGLSVVSIEGEISECIGERLSESMMELKLKKVNELLVEKCQGPGVIANCGDLKDFLDAELVGVVSYVLSKLKRLLIDHGGKLWLIGFLADDKDYKKLLEQFPSIEMDLDLHLLPITASSMGGKPFKSSLMRSFVPFGGFFTMSSELKSPCTSLTKPTNLCKSCNEKYEKEVSDVQKGVSSDSVADRQSANLASWLQTVECETSKRSCTEEATKDKTVLDARVIALQRKWIGICQRLHCSTSQMDTTLPKPYSSIATTLEQRPISRDAVSVGTLSSGNTTTILSSCPPSSDWQKNSPPKQNVFSRAKLSDSSIAQAEIPAQNLGLNDFQKSSSFQQRISLPIARTSSPSVVSVATDLTLGALYDSSKESRRNTNLQDDCSDVRNSESSKSLEKSPSQISQSSSCSHHHGKQMYSKELGHQWDVLAEKIYWQSEAIRSIGLTVSRCINENARYHCSIKGSSVWLSFLGPDKVGKRKIAASVAEIASGRKDRLLYLDLSTRDTNIPNYIVACYDSKYAKMHSERELIVDYLAEMLSKHPDSVVFLENVEKADFMVRCSLNQAIKTGKFPDSRGRPIYVNNKIFILASTVFKGSKDMHFVKEAPDFPEEIILEARNMQLQIIVESGSDIYGRNSNTTGVSLSSKRKLTNDGSTNGKISKRACQISTICFIDLNMPIDGSMGEDSDIDKSDDDCSDNSDVAWLEELLEHVDENVVSKPFDFDSLSQKILRDIDLCLRKRVGATLLLEIDRQVMVQILAAAWLTEGEDALEHWIEQVLCSGLEEACKRCNGASGYVFKLVPCDGLVANAQASRVCLPAKINV